MSARNSTPLGIQLLVGGGGAVVVGAMMWSLLSYMESMSVTTRGAWWVPVLPVLLPVLVIGSILWWVYSQA